MADLTSIEHDDRAPLPGAVRDRKRETWHALEEALAHRQVRRQLLARRLAAAALLAVASVAAVSPLLRSRGPSVPEADPSAADAVAIRPIEQVSDPKVRIKLELLDDEELIEELAAAGFTRGVIRMGDEVWVVGR